MSCTVGGSQGKRTVSSPTGKPFVKTLRQSGMLSRLRHLTKLFPWCRRPWKRRFRDSFHCRPYCPRRRLSWLVRRPKDTFNSVHHNLATGADAVPVAFGVYSHGILLCVGVLTLNGITSSCRTSPPGAKTAKNGSECIVRKCPLSSKAFKSFSKSFLAASLLTM